MNCTNQTDTHSWQDSLKHGDVIAFRFPHERQNGAGEEPKVRPTLVLDVIEQKGERMAVLAYGTSSRRRRRSAQLISIFCPKELAMSGLNRPTRFDGTRIVRVPLDHSGFSVSKILSTPVLGRLSGACAKRAASVRAAGRAFCSRNVMPSNFIF